NALQKLTNITINSGNTSAVIHDIDKLLTELPPSPYTDTPENKENLENMYQTPFNISIPTQKNQAIAVNDILVEDLSTIKDSLSNIDTLLVEIDVSVDQANDDFDEVTAATDNLTATLD